MNNKMRRAARMIAFVTAPALTDAAGLKLWVLTLIVAFAAGAGWEDTGWD